MDKPLVTKNSRVSGFSLLELSVVLTIVGILLYSTITVGMAQIEVAKVKSTQDKLDKISGAITLYVKMNGALPCPAAPGAAASSASFGVASISGGACNASGILTYSAGPPVYVVYTGVLPNRSLNLADDFMFDAWGDRITYVVAKNCVNTAYWSTSYPPASGNKYACQGVGLSDTDGGVITVKDASGNTISSDAAYFVVSHGKNGKGAYTKGGTKNISPPSSITEQGNGNFTGTTPNASTANTVYYDAVFNDGNTASYYDDVVRWKNSAMINYDANH